MKKKSSSFDLTPLLDVILILLFLALIVNTGEMIDYRTQLEESEEQRIILEKERNETTLALNEANERLVALSDWDNERTSLTDELGALNDWRAATEQAIHFISIFIQTDVEPRIINIGARSDIEKTIELIWADDDSNIITNEDSVVSEFNRILSEIIELETDGQSVLIMFDYTDIRRQEFNLIDRCIRSLIDILNLRLDTNIYYSSYVSD